MMPSCSIFVSMNKAEKSVTCYFYTDEDVLIIIYYPYTKNREICWDIYDTTGLHMTPTNIMNDMKRQGLFDMYFALEWNDVIDQYFYNLNLSTV